MDEKKNSSENKSIISPFFQATEFFPHSRFAISLVFGIVIFFWLAAFIMYQFYLGVGLPQRQSVVFAQASSQLLFMLVPAIAVMKYSPLGVTHLFRFKSSITTLQWLFGLLGVVILQAISIGYVVVIEHSLPTGLWEWYESVYNTVQSQNEMLMGGTSSLEVLQSLFVVALVPAIAEEVLFRGLLQRSLEEVYDPSKAIMISALIFSAIHLNSILFIPLALMGCFLGYCAYHTQSLALPIVIHFFNNALVLVMSHGSEASSSRFISDEIGLTEGTVIFLIGLVLILGLVYLLNTRTPRFSSSNS